MDELATRYSLHALHVEDCRTGVQRTKVENESDYLFIALMLMAPERGNNLPAAGILNLFVGRDFVITVHSEPVALLDRLRSLGEDMRADQVLYRVIDGVVESWLPSIERLEDSIERLQDQVIGWPRPTLLEQIAETRNTLLQLRRILSGTRHAVFQLRHVVSPIIGEDMSPFLRDVHDDLAINLETIAGERDRFGRRTGHLPLERGQPHNRGDTHADSPRYCGSALTRGYELSRNGDRISVLGKVVVDV